MIKLSERLAAETQKKNAQPPAKPGTQDYHLLSMTSNLALLRHSCMRGLLLEELEAAGR